MKVNYLFALLLCGLLFSMGCGKPHKAESLTPDDISGGYAIVSRFQTTGYAQDVVKKNNLAYIAQGEAGLMIVDVADPKKPKAVSTTSKGIRGYSNKIAMKDNAVYLANGSFGVTTLNVIDPNTPVITGTNSTIKPAKNFYIMGDFLYTAVSEVGIIIANISNLYHPNPQGITKTSGYAKGVTITNDTNYLLAACGEVGLSIFNISDFQDGQGTYPLAGWVDTPGYAEAVTILDNKSIAFLACGTAGLQIIDFSDASNIHIVGSYNSSGYAKELLYKNKRIYMTTEKSGLQIIDVSSLTSPKLIGMIDTEYALGLDMDDKYIYVADEYEGLIIISIPD